MIRPWADVAELDRLWERVASGVAPLGADLRLRTPSASWVRFHTLPCSERIAHTDAQMAEQMHRYLSVLVALGTPRLVTTCGGVDLPCAHWLDLPGDPPISVYASEVDTAEDLVPLLRLVAEDCAHDVIVAPADLRWMMHPYDGGMDVVGDYPDDLAKRFDGWRSPRPDGL